MRLILLAATLWLVDAAVPQLPSYFKVCARLDPKFDECAVKSGREAIPYLVKGERLFKLPSSDPFEIEEVKLVNGDGRRQMTLTLRDVKLHGLKDINLHNATSDFPKGHASILLSLPVLIMLGTYDVSGQILLLPIKGSGNMNITLIDTKITLPFDFIKEKNNGVDYGVVTTAQIFLDPKRVHIHLDNLFNGDKLLGDEMNKFLDENWRDVYNEMMPSISVAFVEIFKGIVNTISKQFPFDVLFPEYLP